MVTDVLLGCCLLAEVQKSPPLSVYDVLLSRYSSGPSFNVHLWDFFLLFYHLASEYSFQQATQIEATLMSSMTCVRH